MKIIVGLGNPGTRYEQTRHNAGWLALDAFIESTGLQVGSWGQKFHSSMAEATMGEEKIILAKPQTYMNNSGDAVREICNFYKANPAISLLVVHDEVDLPFGTVRTNTGSGPAGHNGVKSVIDALGTQDFTRLRIGVESRATRTDMPTDAFVLSPFTKDETEKLQKDVLPKATEEIKKFLTH